MISKYHHIYVFHVLKINISIFINLKKKIIHAPQTSLLFYQGDPTTIYDTRFPEPPFTPQ